MKNINNYIFENMTSNKSILDGIDITKWHWKSFYSQDDFQKTCKEKVKEFANRNKEVENLYKNSKPYERIELLYKDTYRDYIGIDSNKSKSQLDNMYEDEMKHLDKVIKETGWGTYESTCLPQGWWVFMYWVIKQK